jgi:enoyl reductase-like protein
MEFKSFGEFLVRSGHAMVPKMIIKVADRCTSKILRIAEGYDPSNAEAFSATPTSTSQRSIDRTQWTYTVHSMLREFGNADDQHLSTADCPVFYHLCTCSFFEMNILLVRSAQQDNVAGAQ